MYILFSMQQSECQDMREHKLRQAGLTMCILRKKKKSLTALKKKKKMQKLIC